MPGTLVRSASRRRWTKPTTSRARRSGRVGDLGQHDLVFLLRGRVVDPVVEAAPLERVVDLAGPVRGQDDPRRRLGPDRADLRDRDLEVGQDLEQIRLELLVGPVDLVDEQDGRDPVGRLERLEERPADQEVLAEDVVRRRVLRLAARLEQPDLEHLARVVPLVDGRVDVEPLVALEPDQAGAERCGQDLRQLGLADPGLALEQQRATELQGEEDGRRRAIGPRCSRGSGNPPGSPRSNGSPRGAMRGRSSAESTRVARTAGTGRGRAANGGPTHVRAGVATR